MQNLGMPHQSGAGMSGLGGGHPHFLFDDAFDRDERGQPKKKYLRRMIDYNPTLIKYKTDILLTQHRPLYKTGNQKAHLSYMKDMGPGYLGYESPFLCKYIHTAINKMRCAINCVEWQPNGQRVLTGSQTGEFTLWNGVHFNFENLMQAHTASIRAMKWTPDGANLLSGDSSGLIKVWNANYFCFKQIEAHQETLRDLSVSPSGAKFVSCADENAAKLWDFPTFKEERTFNGHGWEVKTIDWHPSMSLVATGSKDFNIKLWDPRQSEAITTIYAHKSVVGRVRWSPNGQWLISGSRDQLIKMMDVRKMSIDKVFKGHTREITSLSWHPTAVGIFCSGSYDGQICHWDVAQDSKPVESLIGAHDGSIWALAYHPLGHLMVSGSHDNCTKFWARPRPGDPDPQEQIPKGRMYYTHVAQAEARKKALEAAAVDSKSAAKFVAGRADADDDEA
ncbi:WD repeat-containing protein 33 [Perkinsus olseni]|uniref:WD repeat-containing protein 33 n=1 Tax=Perkinsus olseni TaxID=32597 RepID=A0A7J6LNP7_PEROL|nr:WD repeat-containing protein 33 [Perkinsus olseni]